MNLRHLARKLEADHPAGLTASEQLLSNYDLLPVPEEQKTWGWLSFVSLRPRSRRAFAYPLRCIFGSPTVITSTRLSSRHR